MTIESQLMLLIRSNESLRLRVESILSELTDNYSEIRALVGAEFFVSRSIVDNVDTPLKFAANSIEGIQQKIEAFRRTSPNKPVNVIVDSFADALPLNLTSSRVTWKFLGANDIQFTKKDPAIPEAALLVKADRIRIEGISLYYTNGDETMDQAAEVNDASRGNLEIRNGTFVGVSGDALDGSYFSSGNFTRPRGG